MNDAPTVFRPSREHVIAIAMMTGIALIGVLWAPLYLGWVLLFPPLAIAWVYKASTTVGPDGIDIAYLFRKDIHVGWDELAGVNFQATKAVATTTNGEQHPLPGVTFNSLPKLAEASGGRITDPIAQAEMAADGKYEIIDKEGYSVLLSKVEYEQYLRDHPDTPGPRPTAAPQEGDK